MKLSKIFSVCFFATLAIPAQGWADDTDLYLNPELNQNRSKVLIIFDNSGSMDTEVVGVQKGYDPATTYDAVGSLHSYQGRMIYFAIGTGMDESSLPVPDSPSESRRFNELINGCATAKAALDTYGRFTGYVREFKFTGNGKGTWQQIKENSGAEKNNPVDCGEDIEAGIADNNTSLTGYASGFPQNSVKSGNTYLPYGGSDTNAQDTAKAIGFGSGELVTLYTDNYLRWYTLYKNGSLPPDETPPTRLEMAQNAITGVISSIPSVDFGLALFNLNYPYEGNRDGGRIVAGIKQRTSAEKDALINTVESIPAETNTPLCETLFEAYKYFSGGTIKFGHADSKYSNWYKGNTPSYDTSIESSGSYISPLSECEKVAYIIYITDGEPTLDASANPAITILNNSPYKYDTVNHKTSYLPALAEYMFNNDILPKVDNFQRVITHTIGFSLAEGSEAEPLLIETAKRGGGKYFAANDTAQLQEKISNIVDEITKTGQRFSAPGVAFSNADPTRTLDAAYYALFRPSQSPKWAGNLKKLKVNSAGALVDANGKPAIDSTGGIAESACSFWSNCSGAPDGNDVILGGAARTIAPDNRLLYSDIGTGGTVAALTLSNATQYAGSADALATYMSLPLMNVSADLSKAFDWIKGKNVDKADDEFTSEDFDGVRGDIIGDPLHSQPLAIDYGGDGTDVVIFFGTNHGMLHSFRDNGTSVSENWAFMPYQLLPNVTTLRGNNYSLGHSIYGMDGSPVAYLERNSVGTVTKAWLFIGMRRGGESYFAFDITDPSSQPKLMWKISNSTTGFSDLGQTWSPPVVAKVPGSDKPVIIFGGGYNLGYDSGTGSNSDGRAVFIVDAETGTLVHKFGATGNTILSGMEDSIVGSLATLDSNSDGYIDRLYAADLGGNVWRMDMPSAAKSTWSGFKFAELGGALSSIDRMFFYEPVVAQTFFTNMTEMTITTDAGTEKTISYQNVPYDAVTLGSGNRASPLSKVTEDMFFVLQDRNVITQTFGSGGTAVPSAITFTNLYNVTTASPITDTENIAFGEKLGWYYDFSTAGEKSLSPSVIIKGKVYFSSFIPTQSGSSENTCTVSSLGRLYTLDLHKGGRYAQEYIDVCENCIPQPPKIITPPKDPDEPDNPDAVLIIGRGECDEKGENCTGTVDIESGLSTNKIYYHINE